MIDVALEVERTQGKKPVEAIYEACLLRFRPIMMTTMAALLGGLPLALGNGVAPNCIVRWVSRCRRPYCQSGADAVHYPRRVCLS